MLENSKKRVRIKINTPKGVRHLVYKPTIKIDDNVEGEEALLCSQCSYYSKCDKFINPQETDDPDSTFMEFCSNIGFNKDDTDPSEYIPEEGTIEENLGDILELYPDSYQVFIKKGGYVKLTDVIDSVCKDSCPFWNENYSECTSTNKMCILEGLIDKKK